MSMLPPAAERLQRIVERRDRCRRIGGMPWPEYIILLVITLGAGAVFHLGLSVNLVAMLAASRIWGRVRAA